MPPRARVCLLARQDDGIGPQAACERWFRDTEVPTWLEKNIQQGGKRAGIKGRRWFVFNCWCQFHSKQTDSPSANCVNDQGAVYVATELSEGKVEPDLWHLKSA